MPIAIVSISEPGAVMIFRRLLGGYWDSKDLLGQLLHRITTLILIATTVSLSIGTGKIGLCEDNRSVPNFVIILIDDNGGPSFWKPRPEILDVINAGTAIVPPAQGKLLGYRFVSECFQRAIGGNGSVNLPLSFGKGVLCQQDAGGVEDVEQKEY